MAKTGRKLKLVLLMNNATGCHIAGWRHPDAAIGGRHKLAHYQHLATVAERGKFDAVFFADSVAIAGPETRDAFGGTDVLRLEPLSVLAALSTVTERIGLVATASTTYQEPFNVARAFATLDHLSNGRAGWNMVTSSHEAEAHNFSRDHHPEHEQRYERAREFVDVVTGLWDSWEDDAFLNDKSSGRYFDRDKVHEIAHRGRHFAVRGPLNVARPPQGHPVIFQAGGSDAGRQLAADTADAIFATPVTIDAARAFYQDVKGRAVRNGRAPEDIVIASGLTPIIGRTDAEARENFEQLQSLVSPSVAVNRLQQDLGGFDLSGYPIDGPLPEIPPGNGSLWAQSKYVTMARREGLTIRQLAARVGVGPTVVGSPQTIADHIEAWFRAGVVDGYAIAPAYLPGGLEAFVDAVVPELQRRGLFRDDYESTTLRGNLGLASPANRFAAATARVVSRAVV